MLPSKKEVYVAKLVNNDIIVGYNMNIVEGGIKISYPLSLKEEIQDDNYVCFLTGWIPLSKYGTVEILASSIITVVKANDELSKTYLDKISIMIDDPSFGHSVDDIYMQPIVNTIQ